MTRFRFDPLAIPDVIRVDLERVSDARGSFAELYRASPFRDAGLPTHFAQDSLTLSRRGALRGLHFQVPPTAQGKLVGPIEGRIFDVVVDVRPASPTFGRWVGAELDAEEPALLWVPPGFAHGYQILSEAATVFYKATHEYDPPRERGVRWDDPAIGIEWPLSDPVLSDKDRGLPPLSALDLPDGPW